MTSTLKLLWLTSALVLGSLLDRPLAQAAVDPNLPAASYTLVEEAAARIALAPAEIKSILIQAGRDQRYRNMLEAGDLTRLASAADGDAEASAEAAQGLVSASPYKLVSLHREAIGRVSLAQLNAIEARLQTLIVDGRLQLQQGALVYTPAPLWPKLLLAAAGAAGVALAAGGGGGGDDQTPAAPWSAPSFATSSDYRSDYRHQLVGTELAHQRGYDGSGVIIGVVDSGFRTSHEELSGQFVAFYNAYTGSTSAASVADLDGHGTHVAGIIAAKADGNGVTGVAPGAKLVGVRIGDDVNGSIAPLSDAQTGAAIDYAVAQGAAFVNNSWGVRVAITDLSRADIEAGAPLELKAYRDAAAADVVMVFANGNGAPTLTQPNVEAGLPFHFAELKQHWVAVGAVGANGLITDYSQPCGVAADWCLVAPGGATGNLIVSSYNLSDTSLAAGAGTSIAAPMVSGALAVLKQRFPTLSNDTIVDRLFLTANKTGPYADRAVYGQGLLDLDKATNPLGPLAVVDPLSDPRQGSSALPLAETRIRLGGGYGTRLAEQLGRVQLAVADRQGAGFFVNLGSLVTPAEPSLDLAARLQAWQRPAASRVAAGGGEWRVAFAGGERSRLRQLNFSQQGGNWRGQGGIVAQPQSLLAPTGRASLNTAALQLPFTAGAEGYWSAASAWQFDGWSLEALAVSPYGQSEAGADRAGMRSRLALTGLGWQPYPALQLGLQLGAGEELDRLAGARFDGALAVADATPFRFVGLWSDLALDEATRLRLALQLAALRPTAGRHSLIQTLGEQRLSAMAAELTHQLEPRHFGASQWVGFGLSQPLRVESGSLTLNYADGYAGDRFNQRQQRFDLAAEARQLDYELFYQLDNGHGLRLKSALLWQHHAGHRRGSDNAAWLLALQQAF